MQHMTSEQEFTLTHLGIERWVTRTWPLSASVAPSCRLWVVHDAEPHESKALNLLANLLRSMRFPPHTIRIKSREELTIDSLDRPQVVLWLGAPRPALSSEIKTVFSLSLHHLLAHPADKKQAYLDLLQVKQWLLPCDQLV
jgi:DNA polymerase III psi subunit